MYSEFIPKRSFYGRHQSILWTGFSEGVVERAPIKYSWMIFGRSCLPLPPPPSIYYLSISLPLIAGLPAEPAPLRQRSPRRSSTNPPSLKHSNRWITNTRIMSLTKCCALPAPADQVQYIMMAGPVHCFWAHLLTSVAASVPILCLFWPSWK